MTPRTAISTQPGLLLVDDDENARAELNYWLSCHGFEVHELADASQVMGLLSRRRWDLILLDIEMPGTSGLELLQSIRKIYPADVLPVMMATARDRSCDIVGALHAGANDYVTKPFDLPVVLARVQTQVALSQARNELAQANHRMCQELEAAARVQAALLPRVAPEVPGYRCAWYYRPCTELAGDLLGLIRVPDGRLCVYVLDVVHHGVRAALWAVMINRVLSRLLAECDLSPAEIMEALNQEFPWDDRTQQYFSMQIGFLNPADHLFRFASAGHPGPIVVYNDGRTEVLRLESQLIGLAMEPFENYEIALQPGDRLYLFSDGMYEAHNPAGVQIGTPVCATILAEAHSRGLEQSLAHLTTRLQGWIGSDAVPHDDISIVALQRE
jgi:sigma-B regulation protein RsbU (phosphoserine phosphatase)